MENSVCLKVFPRKILRRTGPTPALDKLPGVRPIGIVECRKRIEEKAIALATRLEMEQKCGADQLCSEIRAGIEAAGHAMSALFYTDETEGFILVDVSNALNSLGRPAMLWNCWVLLPRRLLFLFYSTAGRQ